jgi:hypothetical protein
MKGGREGGKEREGRGKKGRRKERRWKEGRERKMEKKSGNQMVAYFYLIFGNKRKILSN